MRLLRRLVIAPALGVALAGLVPDAAEAGPLVEALKSRQARLDALLAKAADPLSAAQKTALEGLLAESIDFAEMGRAALAEEWPKRSEAERGEYARAFEGLVRASLVRRPEIYRVQSVSYEREAVEGDGGRVVTMVRSKDATTEVAYTFRRSGGSWRIVDYAIDGVSTVRNYRSQFARLLARRGFSGLVERLRSRRAELESES